MTEEERFSSDDGDVSVGGTTLDEAQERFHSMGPREFQNKIAGEYMKQLMQYEADDMIGDDTWLDGLTEIRDYLLGKKS